MLWQFFIDNLQAYKESIVLAINGVYTKTTKFHHRHAYRSSRIGPITTTSAIALTVQNIFHLL